MKKLAVVLFILLIVVSTACRRRSASGTGSSTSGFTISVSVSGLDGGILTLQLNGGSDLQVNSDGTSSFNSTLASGATYDVTVSNQPLCRPQTCTVTGGTGTATSNVTLNVSCSGDTLMLMSANWGDNTLKMTDDLYSHAHLSPASPREISGPSTTLTQMVYPGTLTLDRNRKKAYVSNMTAIKVFNDFDIADGDIPPDATLSMTGVTFYSLSIDSYRDRLYLAGTRSSSNYIWIVENASTKDGVITADHELAGHSDTTTIFIDEYNDRLYNLGHSGGLSTYDNASSLTSASTASRTAVITQLGVSPSVYSFWVDACNDKLVVSQRNGSSLDNELAIFNSASAMTGTYSFDSGSHAQLDFGDQMMNVAVDTSNDKLLAWADSATRIEIWNNFSTLSGAIGASSKIVTGVANGAYGLGIYLY